MNLFALFRDVNTKEEAIDYLQSKNVLHRRRVCPEGHPMTFRFDKWKCRKGTCDVSVNLKVGTWLELSKFHLEKVVWFIYSWCQQYASSKFCFNELIMSSNTMTDWKNYLREVCAKSLLLNPMEIGGEGLTVEMHESCFSPKKTKGVNNVSEQQWVFGGVCWETSECFLFAVAEPTAETLLEAVSASVKPGSTIVSDLWTSYGGSHLLPKHYTLLTVNKSRSIFVNPSTGSEVEALYPSAKRPKRKRRPDTVHRGQDSYLCEFLWRKRHKNVDLVEQIYKDIASLFPLQEVVQ